jgi:hypothetical protein
VYPERENHVFLPLHPLLLWAPCIARRLWAGAVKKYLFGHVLITVRQARQRRDADVAGEGQLGRFTAGQS